MINVNSNRIAINIFIEAYNDISIKKTILLEIDETIQAIELIRQAIKQFNETFIEENQSIALDSDLRHYSLRLAKKNGNPNMDFPGN